MQVSVYVVGSIHILTPETDEKRKTAPGLDPEYRRRRNLRDARRREVEQMIGFHDDAPIGWDCPMPAVDPVLYERGVRVWKVRP